MGHLIASSSVSTLKALFHVLKVLIEWCLVVGQNDILFVALSGKKLNCSSLFGLDIDSNKVARSTYAYNHTVFIIDRGTCAEIMLSVLPGMFVDVSWGRIPGITRGMFC